MLLIYFFVRARFYKPSGPPSACFAANAPPAAFGKQRPAFKESGTTKPRATWVTRGFTFYEHDYLAELRFPLNLTLNCRDFAFIADSLFLVTKFRVSQ